MTPREILIAAKARIDKPSKWTRLESKSANGRRVCAAQAIWLKGAEDYGRVTECFRLAVGISVIEYNDSHTHAEVMAAFDRAIEMAPDA